MRVHADVYGVSQFLGILSALFFVLSADAYPARPRVRRGYTLVLVGGVALVRAGAAGARQVAVFAPGHVLIAGALAAAGVGHLILLRQVRMLGAAVVGVALLLIAGVARVDRAVRVDRRLRPATTSALVFILVLYLIAALGMQLMTFEDMTLELRRTNRRLEAAQGKLRRMVITDPLTGCRNRRFFDEIIGRELQRHRRYGIPMSLLFVDVDRFKAVNDTLGHDAGDRVLREVAAFLLSNIREADYVFRWGGDEFLILLSCGEEEARRRGAPCSRISRATPPAASLPAGVGLSIGCAEIATRPKTSWRSSRSPTSGCTRTSGAAAPQRSHRCRPRCSVEPRRVASRLLQPYTPSSCRSFSRDRSEPPNRQLQSEPTSDTASSTRPRPSPTRRARSAASSARWERGARTRSRAVRQRDQRQRQDRPPPE